MQLAVALIERKEYNENMSSPNPSQVPAHTSIRTTKKSPVHRRRFGGRSARVRTAVFEATLELLQEQGYDALSFAAIAKRAGVNKTSLYRRWKSKEQLVLNVVENHVQDFPLSDTGTLRSDLIHLIQSMFTFNQSAVGQAFIQMITVSTNVSSIGTYPKDYWQRSYSHLRPLFDRAIARGELSPQTDLQLLFEMLLGVLFIHVFVLRESLDETLAERIVDLLLAGAGTSLSKE